MSALSVTDEEARILLNTHAAHVMVFGEVKTASAIRGLAAELLDARAAIQRVRDLCNRSGVDGPRPSEILALLPPEVPE